MTDAPRPSLPDTLLAEAERGVPEATERLATLLYDEIRALAGRQLARERPDHTLQATALAHEAYLRLIDQKRTDWKERAQFLAVAARTIRRILVDHARSRAADKRGGNDARMTLDESALAGFEDRVDVLALHEALDQLGDLNERHRDVVELRFFAGLTAEETAHVLGVSPQTVRYDWRMARAWLRGRLE